MILSNLDREMQIKLWYSDHIKQWRWTLIDPKNPFDQESGQRPDLRDAMQDIATTVEYILKHKHDE